MIHPSLVVQEIAEYMLLYETYSIGPICRPMYDEIQNLLGLPQNEHEFQSSSSNTAITVEKGI